MSHALYAFIVSIIGFAFAIRISDRLIARELFDHQLMTKIGTTYFVCAFALMHVLPRTRTMIWVAIFFPIAIAGVGLSVSVSRRACNFKSDVLSALSIMLLKMKSGRSFRQSLLETTSESERHLRVKLTEIANVVAFSQQKSTSHQAAIRDPFVRELVEEFVLIDQQPHASMRRLSVLRDKLRTEDEFRRRSGQVLARMRAQSLVMCGLYLAVLSFMIWKFGWKSNVRALSTSMMLFVIGRSMDVDGRSEIEMEGLTPPLKCLIEMQSCIQNGETARVGMMRFLKCADSKDPFTLNVRSFLFAWEQGQDWRACVTESKSPHRRALLEVAACGLSGQSILPHLESLRAEITGACELEIREHLELLPLKMLVPLLLFQFPAFLLLLFGPLLKHLIEELNR